MTQKVKSKKIKAPVEHTEQVRVINTIKWLRLKDGSYAGQYLFAIPNGGARVKTSKRFSLQAKRLKDEGVKAGVPDLMLAIPNYSFHGLFIEMKRANKALSKVSNEQLQWQERLNGMGYLSVICYGADNAIDVIKSYLIGLLYENY